MTNEVDFGGYLFKNDGTIISKNYARRGYVRPLKQMIDAHGYPVVTLVINKIRYQAKVHKIIAIWFIDNPNNGLIHKFNTCYVGLTKEQIPCARVWLIDASENKKLKSIWGKRFPQLKKDEVLLENVFTVPKYRGMGIIPAFLYDVAETSKDLGAKYAITFGEVKNKNTSRSYNYAGFSPYIVRRVSYFLFIIFCTFG